MKRLPQMTQRLIRTAGRLVPFFIGMYCYYPAFLQQENHLYPFLDALYAAIKLYAGTTDGSVPVGGLLQLARFWAMAATFSILVSVLNKLNELISWGRLFNPNATVVYGDSAYAHYALESLDRSCRIHGEYELIEGAARYLLMFSGDAENLAFYNAHYAYLRDRRVYILLEDIARQNIENPLVTVFSLSETCARQYWKDHPVLKSEKIAIIGFDSVGKNLLLYGLQMNLIDPAQHFEYHIYGDGDAFRREHSQLDKMTPDEVIFHDDGIRDYREILNFDRIILCGGNGSNAAGGNAAGDVTGDNVVAVSRLLAAAPVCCPIYVYTSNEELITNLFGSDRLVCFGMAEQTARAEMIFNEQAMDAARRQHEFYTKQYGGVPWEKLDAFKRYSNVSSSDYMDTVKRLLAQGVSVETIAELEHLRWDRYHYLHNWVYGPETDSARRVHHSLIPFDELSEAEKLKDVEAIRSKLQ